MRWKQGVHGVGKVDSQASAPATHGGGVYFIINRYAVRKDIETETKGDTGI